MKSFKEHRFEKNPQEKKFVYEFLKQHNQSVDPDLIVFGHPNNSMSPKDYLSDREKDIVISVIQWLGSPVGQSFLDSCGFVPKPNNVDNHIDNHIDDYVDDLKYMKDKLITTSKVPKKYFDGE